VFTIKSDTRLAMVLVKVVKLWLELSVSGYSLYKYQTSLSGKKITLQNSFVNYPQTTNDPNLNYK